MSLQNLTSNFNFAQISILYVFINDQDRFVCARIETEYIYSEFKV